MAELPKWRDAEPVTLTELTAFDALAEIAEEAAQLERHLQDRIDEREQVSREKLSNDPEVQAEAFLVSKEAEARVRILRGAFFLAAFSYFELEVLASSCELDVSEGVVRGTKDDGDEWLSNLLRALQARFKRRRKSAPRRRSASDGVKALEKSLKTVIVDFENLDTRVWQLRELRNVLAHGGGLVPESSKRIQQLLDKGDVLFEEDPWLGEVILLRDGFLAEAVDDLRRVLLWCRRARRAP